MTSVERDTPTPTTTTNAHDPPPPTRRRPARSARSPSLTRSVPLATSTTNTPTTRASPATSTPLSKRSPSPIISFQPTPLSAESPKGVKNITRKVIRHLEGLGHLEMVDMALPVTEEEELDGGGGGGVGGTGSGNGNGEEREVERALYAMGREALALKNREKAARPSLGSEATNGHAHANANGVRHPQPLRKTKSDLEIPRKVLHGSIGFFTLYLYIAEGDVHTVMLVLWMALAVIVPADLLRFKSKKFARTYESFLGFLMRESERDSINGVVWYILGVNFVLSFYPQDVATVAILILSWADTAASTLGRLYGRLTPKLPARLPLLRLPLAPRKSLAGFAAASVTGAVIAAGFWGWVAPLRAGGREISWGWEGGVRRAVVGGAGGEVENLGGGGVLGLMLISVVAGLVSGVAEALDLGSLDDNLTLPIISGGCILGFLKLLGLASSWLFS